MELIEALKATLLSLVFLMLVFIPMEKVFPANRQNILRPHWLLDLLFFAGQYLFWNTLVLSALDYFNGYLGTLIPRNFQLWVRSYPWWAQALVVIILSDLIIYWAHRLQHQVGFLWRFHKVHHSAEHLDWLAAHREHPLDSIYTVGLINLPVFILGFPLQTLAGVVAFRGVWAIYIHSNVRLPLGPLKYVIGAPEMHHWHHALNQHAGNYANISPLMDVIFGTHVCPDKEPEKFGIEDKLPQNYFAQLVYPLLSATLISKLEKGKTKLRQKFKTKSITGD
ncbi:MAG: sterol desaturase family protein [Bacteroidia bacterium]|nr:sterol desaturase family protein [Bacteroidia bacterium]